MLPPHRSLKDKPLVRRVRRVSGTSLRAAGKAIALLLGPDALQKRASVKPSSPGLRSSLRILQR
jgi:hypothetical protein